MSAQLRAASLHISGAALAGNMRAVVQHLHGRARAMAVVKADAYGHGLVETARVMLQNGAYALAVALADEGIALREAGIRVPILILGGATPESARAAVQYHLAQALYDPGTLEAMQKEAARLDSVAHAHLKIDTGMTRVGLRGDAQLQRMLAELKRCTRVKPEGIFTHFAAAEEDPDYTSLQNARFCRAIEMVRAEGYHPLAHAAASAALLKDPALWHDMVRPGVVLYGASVCHLLDGLTPAQRLTARPVRLETVPKGESVGYGRTFIAPRETRVMTLPLGYGDGYPRQLGGRASALVRGRRVPVISRVCMDMMMLDVTDVPGACMEDEAVLLGDQGEERITPDELAALCGTIPYEIMLGFSPRLNRVFVP